MVRKETLLPNQKEYNNQSRKVTDQKKIKSIFVNNKISSPVF